MSHASSRTFAGRADQVGQARAFVRSFLCGCPMLDEAILLTSELCTNAIRRSASGTGGAFDVTVYSDTGYLRIEVRDDGAVSVPAVQSMGALAEDGRGLEIVALTADRWGVCGDASGRRVFFELRWNDTTGPPAPRASEAATPSRAPDPPVTSLAGT